MALQTLTPETLLQQALAFPLNQQRWLAKQLINRLLDNDYFPQNGTWNGDEPLTSASWDDEVARDGHADFHDFHDLPD